MLRTLASSLLTLSFLGTLVTPAFAQNDPGIRTEKVTASEVEVKNDFLVSPTRFVNVLKPGESTTFEINVLNREGQEMTYQILRQDFAPDTEKDDIKIFPEGDGPYSARSWVETTTEFTIQHGERAFIPVTITVPEKASIGDHYTTLMVQRKKTPQGQGIGIIARVGVMLIITANGDFVQSGDLVSFSANSPIFWSRKGAMTMNYKNTGTVHLVPTGIVKITNIFGVEVDEIPFRDWYVYRESSRSRHLMWEPRFALGRYSASLSMTDGAHENPIVATTSFWVLPILPLIIILAIIIVISFLSQLLMSHYEIRKKGDVDKRGTDSSAKKR